MLLEQPTFYLQLISTSDSDVIQCSSGSLTRFLKAEIKYVKESSGTIAHIFLIMSNTCS